MRLPGAFLAQIAIALVVATGASAQTPTTDTSPDTAASPASTPGDAVPKSPDLAPPAQPALQPDEPDADAPIHLHMPVPAPAAPKHVAKHKKPAAVAKVGPSPSVAAKEPPVTPATTTQMPAPPVAPQKSAKRTTVAPNAGGTTTSSENPGLASAVPFSFVTNPSDAPPPLAPAPAPAPPSQPRVAKASPPPAQSLPAEENVELKHGMARQSQILFAPGAPDPSADALDAIRGLAGPLNTALAAGASRIQVVAYGGNRGDHSSDARRLSLKRALNIRKLLIDGGVPASRIDVRAMGGATDGAAADRVDVFTKA